MEGRGISGRGEKITLPSIVYSIRKEMKDHFEMISRRLNDKLAKLSKN